MSRTDAHAPSHVRLARGDLAALRVALEAWRGNDGTAFDALFPPSRRRR